jgi:hypothetical protein
MGGGPITDTSGGLELVFYDRVAKKGSFVTSGEVPGPPSDAVSQPDAARMFSAAKGRQGSDIELSLSGDGRYLVFNSTYIDLVPGDDTSQDVFLYDRVTGRTRMWAKAAEGDANLRPAISQDGSTIAFMAPGAGAMVGSRKTGKIRKVYGAARWGNKGYSRIWINSNGKFIALTSGYQPVRVDTRTKVVQWIGQQFEGSTAMDGTGNLVGWVPQIGYQGANGCAFMLTNLLTGKTQLLMGSGGAVSQPNQPGCVLQVTLSRDGNTALFMDAQNGNTAVDPDRLVRMDLRTGARFVEQHEARVGGACQGPCASGFTRPTMPMSGALYAFTTQEHLTSDDTDTDTDLYVRTL